MAAILFMFPNVCCLIGSFGGYCLALMSARWGLKRESVALASVGSGQL